MSSCVLSTNKGRLCKNDSFYPECGQSFSTRAFLKYVNTTPFVSSCHGDNDIMLGLLLPNNYPHGNKEIQ
jgi:hypothetical protein